MAGDHACKWGCAGKWKTGSGRSKRDTGWDNSGRFFGSRADEKSAEADAVPYALWLYETNTSMGKPDRNPSNEDSYEIAGGRKKPGGDLPVYEGYLFGFRWEDWTCNRYCRTRKCDLKENWLWQRIQSLYRNPVLSDDLPVLLVYIISACKLEEPCGCLFRCTGKRDWLYGGKVLSQAFKFHLYRWWNADNIRALSVRPSDP